MKTLLFWTTAGISMVLSVAISLVYFRLAMNLIPQAFLSQFNRGAAQTAFVFWGIGLGLMVVLIEAILFWLLPLLIRKKAKA